MIELTSQERQMLIGATEQLAEFAERMQTVFPPKIMQCALLNAYLASMAVERGKDPERGDTVACTEFLQGVRQDAIELVNDIPRGR